MNKELQAIFNKYFAYLTTDFEYQVDSSNYDEQAFGNFIILLSKGDKKIKLISDRSQLFVEIYDPKFGWADKELLLEACGIMKTRFKMTYDLWDGYEIQNQSTDLKEHKDILNI